jgi:hypothetical protein
MAQTAQKEKEEHGAQEAKAAEGNPSVSGARTVCAERMKAQGGIGAALKGMWRAGGVWGLYQGLPTELVRGLLFQAILMATKEKLDTANARLFANLGRRRASGTH